jgi:hypothetical protein
MHVLTRVLSLLSHGQDSPGINNTAPYIKLPRLSGWNKGRYIKAARKGHR